MQNTLMRTIVGSDITETIERKGDSFSDEIDE